MAAHISLWRGAAPRATLPSLIRGPAISGNSLTMAASAPATMQALSLSIYTFRPDSFATLSLPETSHEVLHGRRQKGHRVAVANQRLSQDSPCSSGPESDFSVP